MPWYYSLGFAAAFGGLGIVLAILGFKLFDLIETKIDFSDELRKGNVAVAILGGSFIIGICFIIGRADRQLTDDPHSRETNTEDALRHYLAGIGRVT